MEQSLCQHPWDNGLQWWVYNGCTVRYVYRIFEYLLVLGIFDSLGFRILVLVLGFSVVWHLSWQLMIYLLSSRFKQVWLATTCKLFCWAIRLSCSNLPIYTVGTYQPLAQALLTPKFVGCTTNYTSKLQPWSIWAVNIQQFWWPFGGSVSSAGRYQKYTVTIY